LIETETIEDFTLDVNYQSTKLIANYFLIEIETDETLILNPSNYRLISAISMDENRFSINLEEESDMTIEGIIAPSIEFETLQTYSSSITINNEGFYSENYQISYFFTSTFIQSLSGPEIISISPGTSSSFIVDILPLSRIPRGGGSLLYIEIADQYNSERATFVLSYSETKIDVVEQSCNRHSVLLGQDIVCKSTITNKGYVSDSLTINVIAMNEKGLTEIVDQINIDKLEFQESLVMRTTYFPKTDNNFQMIIEINSNGELLTSSEIPDSINVVTAANEPKTETNLYNAPKIEMSHTVFAISFAGIAFQFRRSENFKYLTFKFFIPMYSRLQKDTLADEPTRQRLLTTIYTEPGSNFTLLKEKLGLHNGTLAHHLNILESNQMIASHRSGRQRLFFPYGSSNNSNIRNSMITNPTQKNIIQIVKENPGITQSMISQQLGMSRQKINYHVNSLSNNSILKVERQGRITRLYPMHFT
jgi:DNA-binding MarR family transcriptional regulator